MVASALSASAGDCCNSCKGTAGCNTWNFCYCELGCAGNIAKGTCVLKNQGNAFYPRCGWERFLWSDCFACLSRPSKLHVQTFLKCCPFLAAPYRAMAASVGWMLVG